MTPRWTSWCARASRITAPSRFGRARRRRHRRADGFDLTRPPLALSLWLFLVAGLVFAMVVVGGITRLTESGLSITEWKPISGAIPP